MHIELTLDCNDLDGQAAFWAAALNYRRAPDRFDGYAGLEPAGEGVPLTLQRVPEPKRAKNRLHLDLLVPTSTPRSPGSNGSAPAPSRRTPATGRAGRCSPTRRATSSASRRTDDRRART